MDTYLAVLPVIDTIQAERCLDGLAPNPHLLVIDNRRENRGVAASWNIGLRAAIANEREWFVILSEAVEFGGVGLLGFLMQLERYPDSVCVGTIGFGWKCVALRTAMCKRVGFFDENFMPAYMEDTDYLVRMDKAGFDSPRENGRRFPHVAIEARNHIGDAHVLKRRLVEVDFAAHRRYWAAKWGDTRDHGGHFWDHPFNDPDHDWSWWPPPDDPRASEVVRRAAA